MCTHPSIQSDPNKPSGRLRLLEDVAAAGADFLDLEVGGRRVVFLNEPSLIQKVLVEHASSFEKSSFQLAVMGGGEGLVMRGFGEGLLTSSNAIHQRQARIIGKLFGPNHLRRYVGAMAELSNTQQLAWAEGSTIDLGAELMQLSVRIIGATLFSTDFVPHEARLVEAMSFLTGILGRGGHSRSAPHPAEEQIRESSQWISGYLAELITHRRQNPRGGGLDPDMIDTLLAVQREDEQAGSPVGGDGGYRVTDTQILDDVITMLFTGAENPRNALLWSLYLLSRHPDILRQARAEIEGVLQGHLVTSEDLARLPFTLQVFKETLRLYPPGYAFGRRVVRRVVLGGVTVEEGDEVVVSPYALHRREGLFDSPLEFRPERFAAGGEQTLSRFAYLPFGAGARACIGGNFALLVGQVVLATLLQNVDLIPTDTSPVYPEPGMTLRSRSRVRMQVHHRSSPRGATC